MLFLLFKLDADRFALPACDVKEVLPLVTTRVLPGAPAGISGVANYRSLAVPVLDLALLALGRPSARRVSTRMLIVDFPSADGRERLLAVVVENATEMMAMEPTDFRPLGIATAGARYLGPVAHDPRGMIQRVDFSALLTDELRAALDAAGAVEPTPAAVAR